MEGANATSPQCAPLARIVGAAESLAWLELLAVESCPSWRDNLREVREKLAGAPEATIIWTRGAFETDLRPLIRQWVTQAGFEVLSFNGINEKYSVGVAKMVRAGKPYRRGVHFFSFVPEKRTSWP